MTYLKKSVFLAIKLGITSVLIYVLFSHADSEKLLPILSEADPRTIIVALALQLLAFFMVAVRWWLLMHRIDPHIHFRSVLPSYFLGLFANNFLPTSVGGDAIRTVHLHLLGYNPRALVSSAVIDRSIGITGVLILGCVALFFSQHLSLGTGETWALLIALGVILAAIALMFSPNTGRWLDGLASRNHKNRILKFLIDTAAMCHAYRNHVRLLAGMLGMTLVLQTIVIVTYALLAHGIGLELPVLIYFMVIPVVILASNLPISIGGLGVREGVLAGLLVFWGADTQQAISLSLLYLLVLWVATLPGGYIALNLKLRRSTARTSQLNRSLPTGSAYDPTKR